MGGELVVNADDLGISRGATLGILQAHRHGIVTSASLAVTTEDYRHAVEACVGECPNLGLGLHFTLSFGRPAAPPIEIPLLVNSEGFLGLRFGTLLAAMWTRRRDLLLDQIEIELEAQLDRLASAGVAPDHLDSERHVHMIPGVFERVAAVARRRRIPFIRMGRPVGWSATRPGDWPALIRRAGPLKHAALSALTRIHRRLAGSPASADHFLGYLQSGRLDLAIPRLDRLIPRSGVTEVMVHPGIPERSHGVRLGNRQLERYLVSEDRRRELQACLDARSDLAARLKLRTFAQLAKAEGARD